VSTRRAASRPVVAVTGLAKEARIAAGPGVRAIAGGGSAPALVDALERELARGAGGVISFGIAGGLAEDIASGTWLVARAIVTPAERWKCDAAWARSIAERLVGACTADLAGVDAPVTEPAAKRALHRATGAAAVDTESHIAAAIAAAHGLPFAAFRVVADSVRRGLPPAASVALTSDGNISGGAVLGSLARTPAQLPSLLHTAIDARTAFRALSRGRRLLGPGLAYPDLGELLFDVS
jgi:adenosylhomocysteine nucleosidase